MTSKSNLSYVVFLASTAALGGLLFGFDIAIITGAGPFIAKRFGLGDLALGWAYSSLLFGCVVGALVAGRFSDRYGRKRVLVWVAVLFGATSIAVALANSFPMFLLARFLGGMAVGGVSLLSPLYVAEVAPPSLRGRLGTSYQLFIIVGIIVSYAINYLLRNTGANNWRWMFLTGLVPSIIFLVAILLAPESPRFLAMKGRSTEAFTILEKIGGTAQASAVLAEIGDSLNLTEPSLRASMRPGVRRALLVSVGLAILIHVSGINTIMDYAPAIFESAGWHGDLALASTVIVGFTQLVFTLVSFTLIDRYGRKPLYVVGSVGMAATTALLAVAAVSHRFQGVLVLSLILAYLAFFATCIGPVFWTLLPEIFPNDVRAKAMTVPVLVQWLANAVVVLLFPLAFHQGGKVFTFSFLALMCFAQGVFTWLLIPETKNTHLEEIERFWERPAGISFRQAPGRRKEELAASGPLVMKSPRTDV